MTALSLCDRSPPEPCPTPFNLAHYVLSAGADTDVALEVIRHPQAPPEIWYYTDLRDAIWRSAGGLRNAGISPGDRVLLRIGNDPAFAVVFLAAVALGAVPVPTSADLTPSEVMHLAETLRPAATVFAGGLSPVPSIGPIIDPDAVAALRRAEPLAPVPTDPNALAYMVFTSGSGGRPRAVMHAHRAVWARRMMWKGWYGLNPKDRMLHAGAFNWTFTLGTGLLDPWAIGATAMVYAGPPDRHVWGPIAAARRPTLFAAAPGVYRAITQDPDPDWAKNWQSLRHGLCAGEALPDPLRRTWSDATGTQLHEALGMSECSTFISGAPEEIRPPGALGRVQPGRRVAVLDTGGTPVPVDTPGELAIDRRDAGLMLGYFEAPEDTVARYRGDWFLTGDQVTMSADGEVRYLGRADDMLNAGGYRVSPLEVEAALLKHPDVTAAAAAEVEVRPDVRVIAAFYEGTADPTDLETFCSEHLAKYKRPRMFIPRPRLPRSANGKLLRKELRRFTPPARPAAKG
ncbi:MAG: class I adenylate-forming enzyme family protein [Pseudomonadota bacterium]